MNDNFSHWFLTSIYAVSIYTVHSLHELPAYTEVYLYLCEFSIFHRCLPSGTEIHYNYIQWFICNTLTVSLDKVTGWMTGVLLSTEALFFFATASRPVGGPPNFLFWWVPRVRRPKRKTGLLLVPIICLLECVTYQLHPLKMERTPSFLPVALT
jgi:hypothetical protein